LDHVRGLIALSAGPATRRGARSRGLRPRLRWSLLERKSGDRSGRLAGVGRLARRCSGRRGLPRRLRLLRRILRLRGLVGIRGLLLHGLARNHWLPGESRLSWNKGLAGLTWESRLAWNNGLSRLPGLNCLLAGLRRVLRWLLLLVRRRIGIRVTRLAAGRRCRSEAIARPPESHIQRVGHWRIGIVGITGL
jgi:hypothetical protein